MSIKTQGRPPEYARDDELWATYIAPSMEQAEMHPSLGCQGRQESTAGDAGTVTFEEVL